MGDSVNRDQNSQALLDHELKEMTARDYFLWAMGALGAGILLLLAGAFALPRYAGGALYTAFLAFTAFMMMFGIFVLEQRRRESFTREALLRHLMHHQADEGEIDTETETFSREYFFQKLDREIERTSTGSFTFSLMRCEIAGVQQLVRSYGGVACDHLTMVLSRILRQSLRGSDVICHTGRAEFTIVLPNTNQQNAAIPVNRIRNAIEQWNRAATLEYSLKTNIGVCEHPQGAGVEDILTLLRERMQLIRVEQLPQESPLQLESTGRHVC